MVMTPEKWTTFIPLGQTQNLPSLKKKTTPKNLIDFFCAIKFTLLCLPWSHYHHGCSVHCQLFKGQTSQAKRGYCNGRKNGMAGSDMNQMANVCILRSCTRQHVPRMYSLQPVTRTGSEESYLIVQLQYIHIYNYVNDVLSLFGCLVRNL